MEEVVAVSKFSVELMHTVVKTQSLHIYFARVGWLHQTTLEGPEALKTMLNPKALAENGSFSSKTAIETA